MKRHGRATWIGSVIAIGLLWPGIVSAGEELAEYTELRRLFQTDQSGSTAYSVG